MPTRRIPADPLTKTAAIMDNLLDLLESGEFVLPECQEVEDRKKREEKDKRKKQKAEKEDELDT